MTCLFTDIEPHQRHGRRAVPASRDVATDGAATLLNDKPHNRGDLPRHDGFARPPHESDARLPHGPAVEDTTLLTFDGPSQTVAG